MNNTYSFDSSALSGSVTVKLRKNNLSESESYYGSVVRNSATAENLYHQVQQALPSVKRGIIYAVLDALVTVILNLLSQGWAVNLFGLGTFRIAAEGSTDSKTGTIPLTVRFTPSEQTKAAIADVEIAESEYVEVKIEISKIQDVKTGNTDLTLTSSGAVLITGKRLKISGDDSGIWLASVDEDGNVSEDESAWTKIESDLTYNTSGKLLFTLPSLESGSQYVFVLRTRYSSATHERKDLLQAESDVFTII